MDCVFEDGQTSFGLCCFNGCGNTCYQKTCKDIIEMVTETIIEQQCTMGTHQECHDETVTEMVDGVIPDRTLIPGSIPKDYPTQCPIVPAVPNCTADQVRFEALLFNNSCPLIMLQNILIFKKISIS